MPQAPTTKKPKGADAMTVYTTVKAHLHNPEPGTTTVKRLEYGQGSFIVLDFTGGEVGTPDVSAFFPTWDHAAAWARSVLRTIDEAAANEAMLGRVISEIGAPV